MSVPQHPRGAIGGNNLAVASLLALFSFVPFKWVAKGSLLLCAFLFIVDPIPPITRLLSIISLFVVFGLSKAYNHHQRLVESQEGQEADVTITDENKHKTE